MIDNVHGCSWETRQLLVVSRSTHSDTDAKAAALPVAAIAWMQTPSNTILLYYGGRFSGKSGLVGARIRYHMVPCMYMKETEFVEITYKVKYSPFVNFLFF